MISFQSKDVTRTNYILKQSFKMRLFFIDRHFPLLLKLQLIRVNLFKRYSPPLLFFSFGSSYSSLSGTEREVYFVFAFYVSILSSSLHKCINGMRKERPNLFIGLPYF